jgi:hypothetical protein
MHYYNASIFNRTSEIDGQQCDVWQWSVGPCSATECDEIEWCVQRETGGLLHVRRTQRVPNPRNQSVIFDTELRNTFTGYHPTADATSFETPPTGCADMRPIDTQGAREHSQHNDGREEGGGLEGGGLLLNDPARLAQINEAAAGVWTAAPSAMWDGLTADDASARRLGLLRPLAHAPGGPPSSWWGREGRGAGPVAAAGAGAGAGRQRPSSSS